MTTDYRATLRAAIDNMAAAVAYEAANLDDDSEPWTVTFVGDRDHDAWALTGPSGQTFDSFWYSSRESAERYASFLNTLTY